MIAALPPARRHHPSARFDGEVARQFGQAMTAWVSATFLSEQDFADRYLGGGPGGPGVQDLRDAASSIQGATTYAEMREAADALAKAMQAIGLDHWRAFLRNASARAAAAGLAARAGDDRPGEPARVHRIGPAWLSSGSADMVAGSADSTRGVPTPEILDIQRKIEAIAERVKNAINPTITAGISPRALGTLLHTMFKAAVDEAITRGELPLTVRTERTYAGGADARHGEKGAFRTDVVLLKDGKVVAICDYKTGAGPMISATRVDRLRGPVTRAHDVPTAYFKVLHIPFYGPKS